MNKNEPMGLYIHIPFCTQKCRYCDFYSLPKCLEFSPKYTEKVKNAVEYYTEKYERPYNSLYFGGGTPLLLGDGQLCDILESVKPHLTENAEITAEGNPGTAERVDFGRLYAAGFNRLSFGLQSSNQQELTALGRLHTPKEAETVVRYAQNAGFTNISLDLMLGIPYQTEETVRESINFCAALGVTHISAYMLKIEEGTPLAKSKLRFLCADDERSADLYLLACEELEKLGYKQYEISNFAKNGAVSKHNLNYWQQGEYLGIGPSAHSFTENRRWYFGRSLKDFLEKPFAETEREESEGGIWEEYAMLRLRLCEGLDLDTLREKFPEAPAEQIFSSAKLYENTGLLKIIGSKISFTPKGFLVSNTLTGELLF